MPQRLETSIARADLSQCEHEPVHIPGAIQPHGVLLVLDPHSLTITHVSNNVQKLTGLPPSAVLGQSFGILISPEERAAMVQNLSRADLEERNPLKVCLTDGGHFDMIAHHHKQQLIVELEPDTLHPDFDQVYFYNRVRGALVRLRGCSSLSDLYQQTAQEVRRLTGFDRVLLYMFKPDWSGEVVAEDQVKSENVYLGLRFPASDIPSQARALYSSCRLRTVVASNYVPAAIVSSDSLAAAPVDLTHAALRSVSPVHLEYMRNMGVTASLGISLIRNNELWGLITCNHESGERFIPYQARAACGLVGEIVSSLIGEKERFNASQQKVIYQNTQAQLIQYVSQDRDVGRGLTEHSPSLMNVTQSDGAAVYFDNKIHCIGKTPSLDAISELVAWLNEEQGGALTTASLPTHYPPAHAWTKVGCGLIALSISFGDNSVVNQKYLLMWFRPEVAQTVSWGGDPNKPVQEEPGAARLHPRRSFKLWREDVKLKAIAYSEAEIAAAGSLCGALVDAIVEIEASRKIKEKVTLLAESHALLLQQTEENKKVELELRRAQKLEAVGRLAAGIAHEINTPLQYVTDSIQFLQDSTRDLWKAIDMPDPKSHPEPLDLPFLREQMPASFSRSMEGLKRVSTIVRAMKEFAHPGGATKAAADINRVISVVVDIARGEVKDLAEVQLQLGPLPLILCFASDLNQVFLNLIINATQAIEDTLTPTRLRGLIVIKSWQQESNVFVSITDDGGGIPESIRESIFLPFFTTKEVGRGTGQGLALSHSIVVEKHDGSLTVDTEFGRGSTFTIRLPILAA